MLRALKIIPALSSRHHAGLGVYVEILQERIRYDKIIYINTEWIFIINLIDK